jgi:hypothetical protein
MWSSLGDKKKLSAMFYRGKPTFGLAVVVQILRAPETDHYKEVVTVAFRKMLFSLGPSKSAIITRAAPGSSPWSRRRVGRTAEESGLA